MFSWIPEDGRFAGLTMSFSEQTVTRDTKITIKESQIERWISCPIGGSVFEAGTFVMFKEKYSPEVFMKLPGVDAVSQILSFTASLICLQSSIVQESGTHKPRLNLRTSIPA